MLSVRASALQIKGYYASEHETPLSENCSIASDAERVGTLAFTNILRRRVVWSPGIVEPWIDDRDRFLSENWKLPR